MKLVRSCYDIVGVDRNSTTDEIKARYRELVKRFHPDHAKDKEFAQQMFSEITTAYRILVDPSQRAAYDAKLGGATGGATVASMSATSSDADANKAFGRDDERISELLDEADLAILEQQLAKAKALCATVLAEHPDNVRANCIAGDAHMLACHPNRAISAYQEALRVMPSPMIKAKLDRARAAAAIAAQQPPTPAYTRTPANVEHRHASEPARPRKDRSLLHRLLSW
jgi:hypothetical protein